MPVPGVWLETISLDGAFHEGVQVCGRKSRASLSIRFRTQPVVPPPAFNGGSDLIRNLLDVDL